MLQDIFSALASGASQSGNSQSQSGEDLLSGVLNTLLSGSTSTASNNNTAQSGADELGNLVGSLLGGQSSSATAGSQTGSNPLSDLVSSGQNPLINSLIQPVVDQVAAKLGISPEIAMAAATFAIHYLITTQGSKLANGENLSGLLDQHTSQDYLHSAGLTKTFASQNGINTATAANVLSEVFKMLGS